MTPRRHDSLQRCLLVLLTLPLAGCGRFTAPGPPETFPTTAVQGEIFVDGQPLAAGWVTLTPIPPALGDHVIVPVRDGVFATDRASVGELAARVELPRSARDAILRQAPFWKPRLDAFGGIGSPLRCKTRAGQVNQFRFDLIRGTAARFEQ